MDDAAEEGWGMGQNRESDIESDGKRFNSTLLDGEIRAAVRNLTNRGQSGLLAPDDIDSKTGNKVINVLQAKHPEPVIPSIDHFDHYDDAQEGAGLFDVLDTLYYEDDVAKAARRLSGGAGPCGVKSQQLKDWLLRFGAHSEALRVEMGMMATWLTNSAVPYAAIRALNAVRLLAGNKDPGVRPIGCGEVFMRLLADCDHTQSKGKATTVCGNVQLCAGLSSGIEANLHAVRAIFPQSGGWEHDEGIVEEDDEDVDDLPDPGSRNDPLVDPGADPSVEHDRYRENTGFGATLFDAENAFNKLNRILMLWNVGHQWPKGARFTFNCYRHWRICIVENKPGDPPTIVHSKEGITQGDCRAMSVYGVALMPLANKMLQAVPAAVQPWYADDSGSVGEARHSAACLKFLIEYGPQYGYVPEPEKTIHVCKKQDEPMARLAFENEGLDSVNFSRGERYLGGFIGSGASKRVWLEEACAKWTYAVERLALVAGKYPQAAYAGFTISLQAEYQYVQRVVPGTAEFFAPVEAAIRTLFIPALLGIQANEVDADLRDILSHSVKNGGMAIRNPVGSAEHVHEASKAATSHLTESIVDPSVEFDICTHRLKSAEALKKAKEKRLKREAAALAERREGKPAVGRRDTRNCHNGYWLTVVPSRLNGTDLSANEFRDNIRLRYNFKPQDMPSRCDGCGAKFTVEHAMSCKKGGLVHCRHDTTGDEFRHLAGCALGFNKVEREPRIYGASSSRVRATHNDDEATSTPPANTPLSTAQAHDLTEERGDAAVGGFWQRRRDCIFDFRITDTDQHSYRNTEPQKCLAKMEKEKKDKYLRSCHEQRKDFTPMVYSIDGLRGREAAFAEKKLASHLAERWKKDYSQMAYYVRVRMSLAVVRSNTLLLRGSRNRQRRRPLMSDGSAMYDWLTWRD